MIETIFRIRCDGCKKASGAHVAMNHEAAINNLKDQGWESDGAKHYCPGCVKEERK